MIGKRTFILILCLIMIAALFGCKQAQPSASIPATTEPTTAESTPPSQPESAPTEPQPTEPKNVPQSYYDDAQGAWVLLDRFGLELLREHPSERFIVAAEIDCEGMVWEPIPDFSGSLSGLWGGKYNHTISNLIIEGTEHVGFFSTLSGSVTDLNFSDITVRIPDSYGSDCGFLAAQCPGTAEDVAGYGIALDASVDGGCVGAMFGIVSGSVTDCYADGTLTARLMGNAERIGGFAGILESGGSTLQARTDLDITASGANCCIGGIAGELLGNADNIRYGGDLLVAAPEETYMGALVGTLGGTVVRSYSDANVFSLNGAERETAFCGQIGEKGSVSDCYVRDVSHLDEMLPAEEYALRKTAVDYMYAQCTIPWTPAKTFPEYEVEHTDGYKAGTTYFGLPYSNDCCGSMERFASYLDENGILTDEIATINWELMVGNDCADAVYWAWSQVSPTITFTLTKDMICRNGTIQVGDYVLANRSLTKNTCASNTPETMYEAYAQVNMGDAVLWAPGHVRMVAEAAYVYRDSDGNIIPQISYILVHEQGASWSTDKELSTCAVNKKYTFSQLLEDYYIPITIAEFSEGQAGEPEVFCDNTEQTMDAMFVGSIHSNYRINWVKIKLSDDSTEEVVAETTTYTSGNFHHDVYSLLKLNKTVDVTKLKDGVTYHFTVLVGVGNGLEIPVKDYTFTVAAD